MKVTLIDYTGAGHHDPLYAARLLCYVKNTRLTQSQEGFNHFMKNMDEKEILEQMPAIADTIRSSWEFVDFTFQVCDVTRAYTHQQVRTRAASYAQQAMRVVDMSDFDCMIPASVGTNDNEEIKWHWDNAIDAIRHAYSALRRLGVPAQDARGLLPTNVLTNIIIKINLRAFADLLGKRKNLRAQGEYEEVVIDMEKLVLGVMPWTKVFLQPERTATPKLEAILKRLLAGASPVDKPEINDALKELDKVKAAWG